MKQGFVQILAFAWGECRVYQGKRIPGQEFRLVVAVLGRVCERLETLADLVPMACGFRYSESENARRSSTWRFLTELLCVSGNRRPTRRRQTAGRNYSDCLPGITNFSNRGRVLNRALTSSSGTASNGAAAAFQGSSPLEHLFECGAQDEWLPVLDF